MTKELIENIRAIIVPYMAHDLRRINYENMGVEDAEQFSEDMNEILDLATKALLQEPCEDAISRKAVTDTSICEGISCDECSFGKDFEYGFSECQLKKRVDALPSVQPKIKVGHWIPKNKDWWECSECGRMIYSETESDKLKFHAFCGRCGARMIEPQESENKE